MLILMQLRGHSTIRHYHLRSSGVYARMIQKDDHLHVDRKQQILPLGHDSLDAMAVTDSNTRAVVDMQSPYVSGLHLNNSDTELVLPGIHMGIEERSFQLLDYGPYHLA